VTHPVTSHNPKWEFVTSVRHTKTRVIVEDNHVVGDDLITINDTISVLITHRKR
jgi:hypothetical protein